jgi:hypothetical protein
MTKRRWTDEEVARGFDAYRQMCRDESAEQFKRTPRGNARVPYLAAFEAALEASGAVPLSEHLEALRELRETAYDEKRLAAHQTLMNDMDAKLSDLEARYERLREAAQAVLDGALETFNGNVEVSDASLTALEAALRAALKEDS